MSGQKSFFLETCGQQGDKYTTSFSSLLRIKLEKYHRYHLNLNYRKTHFRNRFLFKKQREKKNCLTEFTKRHLKFKSKTFLDSAADDDV